MGHYGSRLYELNITKNSFIDRTDLLVDHILRESQMHLSRVEVS